jgi:hypothetical protein
MNLTPEANVRFEQYLHQMRSALRGSRAVEATEVEQNVREHVEMALAGGDGPIDSARLSAVLEQLGPPNRWLTDDDRPWWRRALHTISQGPEDWRLAYLAFGAFAFALVTFPFGIGVLFMIAAFLFSRATVELLAERDEPLGARRWLVLPAIWVVLLLIALPALIVPVVGFSQMGISDGKIDILDNERAAHGSLERMRLEAGFIAAVAGTWWLVLAGLLAALIKPFRAIFHPVTANFTRKHTGVLALVGIMMAAIGAVLLFAV